MQYDDHVSINQLATHNNNRAEGQTAQYVLIM